MRVCLPISRGDSFLLLVLCGEAPCSSSILTFATRSASTARVRAVSPSSVSSSRVRSAEVNAADKKKIKINQEYVKVGNTHYLSLHCLSSFRLHTQPVEPSPCSTTRRTPRSGCTAAACRANQPLLSRSLKAGRQPDSPCSAYTSPGETQPRPRDPTLVVHSRQCKIGISSC